LVPASIHAEKGERGGRELREREEEGEARDGGCGGNFAGTGSGWKMAVLEYESCNQVVTITELESNSVMS
jgi:hypothetical protein